MVFAEFYMKACDEVIDCGNSGVWFLEPDWRGLLEDAQLSLENVSDRKIDMDILKEMLELRVKKLNARTDKTKIVMEWLADIITTKIDPGMVTEENEFMKNMIEYLKTNGELVDKQKELAERENLLEKKEDVAARMKTPLNFAKRKANE